MSKRNSTSNINPQVEISEGCIGGEQYSHPSYGLIRVNRCQGSQQHFGSDVDASTSMRLTISEANVTHNLGRSWYHDNKMVTEVNMTAVQYAEMISSPNTQGVPCTITYRNDIGHITYRPPTDQIDMIEAEVKQCFDKAKQKNAAVQDEVKELFQKKSLNKNDKEVILNLIRGLSNDITNSLPFYLDSADEILERKVMEAKTEAEAYMEHLRVQVGEYVLNNPDVLKLTQEKV